MKYISRILLPMFIFALSACAAAPSPEYLKKKEAGMVPIKRVPPKYPRRAALNGIQGCVSVAFDIRRDGLTDNYLVLDSKPEGMFVGAVLLALRDWRFPPREKPVRTNMPVTFGLSNKRTDAIPKCALDPALPEVYEVVD